MDEENKQDSKQKKGRKKDEVTIHFENGEEVVVGTIHGLSKAFNPPKKERDPRTEEILRMQSHLNGKVANISSYWNPKLGQLMLSTLPDYVDSENLEVVAELRWTRWGEVEAAPTYRLVDLGDGGTTEVMNEGQIFVNSKQGPMVFTVGMDGDGDLRLTISFRSGCKEMVADAKGYLDRFIEFAWEHSPLRGKAWQADLSWITRSGVVEEPYLTDAVKQKLDLHAHTFIRNLDKIAETTLKSSRGIILSGPPGCGKTMAIKAMIESYPDATFIVMTSEHLRRHCVKTVYDMARRLAPSVVVLEDIDSAGGLSRKVASHPILGEVLQALNGVDENKGVFTIATTNYVEDLDDALRDRPGRFDVIVTIGLPDSDARYPMLEKHCELNGIKPSEKELTRLVGLTKGFSGAWLAEVFSTATLVALLHDRLGDIRWSDILAAVKDIQDRRQVAYQKTPALPPPPSIDSMNGDLYR
jgi:hypothetical protein